MHNSNPIKFTIFAITDTGLSRTHNEDDFAVCINLDKNDWSFKRDEINQLSDKGALLLVADGMGGTNSGELASQIAQQYVKRAFSELQDIPKSPAAREKLMKKIIINAHHELVSYQLEHLETAGMGTTVVIAWVINNMLHVAWAGDSRCYIYTGIDSFKPFTDDHSFIWKMVQSGNMTAEEARIHPESNIITQSLGTNGEPPEPESKSISLCKNYRILLCSDGLSGMLSDPTLEDVLKTNLPTAETCSQLINLANNAGGEDNITCILMDITDGPPSVVGQTQNEAKITNKLKFYFTAMVIFIVLAGGLLVSNDWQRNSNQDHEEDILFLDNGESNGSHSVAIDSMKIVNPDTVNPSDSLIVPNPDIPSDRNELEKPVDVENDSSFNSINDQEELIDKEEIMGVIDVEQDSNTNILDGVENMEEYNPILPDSTNAKETANSVDLTKKKFNSYP